MKSHEHRSGASTVLITGASSGIGCQLARRFARDGFNLILVARDRQRLEQIASELRKAHAITTNVIVKDLSQPAAPEAIFDEVQRQHLQVEILVNNAGFGEYGAFRDADVRKQLDMIQVNIAALTHLTKLFLPGMLERSSGRVLNVAGIASFMPGPFVAVYFATKAYVQSFSEALSEELRGTGVTVTSLSPGLTRTDFGRRAGMDLSRVPLMPSMDASEVADIGYRALMKGRSFTVTGMLNKVMLVAMRLMPHVLVRRMGRLMLSRA